MRLRYGSFLLLLASSACSTESPPMTDTDGGGTLDAQPSRCVVDGDCDDARYCNGDEQCQPNNPAADGRGCVDGTPPCGAGIACDEATDHCGGSCPHPDEDGDGADSAACGGNDCDDHDAARHPDATEVCDAASVDEDCDPSTFGQRDADGDGHVDASCCNGATCGDDCDDARTSAYGGLVESCDGLDNDCDGAMDEGVLTVYRRDGDGDGFASPTGETMQACSAPPGFVETATDCDDTNEHVNPATTELCADGLDNNCNGSIDESGPREFYGDADGDSFGDPGSPMTTTACTPPPGYAANASDCNDLAASVHPGAMELCNGLDDDCSSGIGGGGIDRSEDRDMDGHSPPTATCAGGLPKDDCNDTAVGIYTGAIETCNGIDDDCSSGGGLAPAEDGDGDGHAPPGATCVGGAYARDDCNDADPGKHPGATEVCDRIDSNCSSGGGVETSEDMDQDGHASTGAQCTGGLPQDDCDDASATAFLGAPELCNRRDDDCSSGGGIEVAEDADMDNFSSTTAACTGGPLPRTDCNDGSGAVHPGVGLGVTTAIAPPLGWLTGSALGAARGTLRPRFHWSSVPLAVGGCGPITYQLQVDDSCTFPGFAGCTFPSPEADVAGIATTTHQLAASLPVSMTAPMGRRYYWRVRACDNGECSAWTTPRYLDVGRARSDFDGDGRADVAVTEGDPMVAATLHVFRGGASGLSTTPSRTFAIGLGPRGGAENALTSADFDADGYQDLVVAGRSTIFLFRGSSSGIAAAPTQMITADPRAVWAGGDVNGDGYADLTYHDQSTVRLVDGMYARFGGPGGVATSASWGVNYNDGAGISVDHANVGDLDGDGWADIVVARQGSSGLILVYPGQAPAPTTTSPISVGQVDGGHCWVLPDVSGDGRSDLLLDDGALRYGAAAPTYASSTASLTIPLPSGASINFGDSAAAADFDGDGDHDLVLIDGTNARAYHYANGGSGLVTTASLMIDLGAGSTYLSVVARDVQGDGLADLLVGQSGHDSPVSDAGAVFVYHGGASGLPTAISTTILGVAGTASARFGRAVAWYWVPRFLAPAPSRTG